ncbi:MAG: AAA family ATPase, partial [Clostridia bacterium]|nr:AAA family ATPase [Clostridia bacterium]
MGTYFNPGNKKFETYTKRKIFVDKTGIIGYLNQFMTEVDKYVCVSRPRRFGKSVTADMLTAYYSRGCDSRTLFEGLYIAKGPSFEEHLNKYNVVYFDVAQFIKTDVNAKCGIEKLRKNLFKELRKEYPDIDFGDQDDLIYVFSEIYEETDIGFIFIIDEWDSPFRERKNDKDSQELYIQFLKDMFKNHEYISLVYMTGILPIKKYLTGSALNMFFEYTMLDPGPVKEYIGFTAEEVKNLAEGTEIPFDDLKYWYDGYNLGGVEIYNSNSVYKALANKDVHGYWEKTESFEDLLGYIKEDRFGIHRVILDLLSDIKRTVNFSGYMNDLVTINNLN